MSLDGLFGIYRLVAEGHLDVLVAGDDLGDVRGQAVQDRVSDEHPAEIMGRVMQSATLDGVDEPGAGNSPVEHLKEGAVGERTVLFIDTALEQPRRGWKPHSLVVVVRRHERHRTE